MIELVAQIDSVNHAVKRLAMRAEQRKALVAAAKTLERLENLRLKLLQSVENKDGEFDDIAEDLVAVLGLDTTRIY
jgi:hypothetical protein